MEKTLNGLIFGATGAVGQDLVKNMVNSTKWGLVYCVVRKPLQQWEKLANKDKLKVIVQADMDKLLKVEEWKFEGIDSVFCCLGSQTKHGQQTFIKIDKTYPLQIADIALKNKIPHYHLVSSVGADPSSFFLYPRTKGQVQRDLKLKGLHKLSIYRPGVLLNRPDARFGQKVGGILPFMPKIQVSEVSLAMMQVAEKQAENSEKHQHIYTNEEMLNLIRGYKEEHKK